MVNPSRPPALPGPPAAPNPVLQAVAGFVVAHPGWSQVAVLALAAVVSFGFAPVGAVLWVGGGIATAVWRRSLISSGVVAAPVRALPAGGPRTATVGTVKASDRLRAAAAALHPIDLELPLDEQIEAAGETYRMRDIRALLAASGMPITRAGVTLDHATAILCPEPWNPHDEFAVAIMVGVFHVGYLPGELAEEYAPPLLRLAQEGRAITGTARIWAKDEGSSARARVTLMAPQADAIARAT